MRIQEQMRDAEADATAAQRLLEGCLEAWGEGEQPPALPLVLSLAAVALCERINAAALRLDHALRYVVARQ